MADDTSTRAMRRIILEAGRDAYTPGWRDDPERNTYDFAEGEPSVYDLRECFFRPEDLPKLRAARDRILTSCDRRDLLDLLIAGVERGDEDLRRLGHCADCGNEIPFDESLCASCEQGRRYDRVSRPDDHVPDADGRDARFTRTDDGYDDPKGYE